MKHFASLITHLDQSNKTKDKLAALSQFFHTASDSDKVWAIANFTHRRPKRQIATKQLREWCMEMSAIPDWLFEECYHTVGDLAETISLLLPLPTQTHELDLSAWIQKLQNLKGLDDEDKKAFLIDSWSRLDRIERFVFNKIITGGFRIGVSQNLITQALANYLNRKKSEIAYALMGNWDPEKISFQELFD